MAASAFAKAAAVAALAALVAATTPTAAAAGATPPTAALFPTAVALRARFADADFAIDTTALRGAPTPSGHLRAATVGTFPALGTPGINSAVALVDLAPGASNTAHTHPRAAETLYLLAGALDVFFVEENGAPPVRVVRNSLRRGGVAVFPTGLIHGQRCVSRRGCKFLAVLSSADPGSVTVAARLCDAPPSAVAATYGVSRRDAALLCGGLPANPTGGRWPRRRRH